MPLQKVNRESTKYNPTTLLSLFELDGTAIGLTPVYRFYDGTNNNFRPITFNGVIYTAFPIKVEGLDYDGKGSLPRGTLTCSNIGGFVSNLLLQNSQLNRAKFTRIRVYARYIDAANFDGNINPYGSADPLAAFEAETFFINRKITENHDVVSFELVSSLELEQVKLPNRPILANICPFRFRDPLSCGVTGAPIADRANRTFLGDYGFSSLTDLGEYNPSTTYAPGDYVYVVSILPQTLGDKLFYVCNVAGTVGAANSPYTNPGRWLADSCPKTIGGCKLRNPTGALPYGGMPGVTRGSFRL